MIVGNAAVFAIESAISRAYERLGLRALGKFVIHVDGCSYGVYRPDATMLACSFDEVGRRIAGRGGHTAPFSTEPDAERIAAELLCGLFADEHEESSPGIVSPGFHDAIYSKDIIWAPDGDAAFDDGSYVLQFDVQERCRLIAFKRSSQGCLYKPTALSDVWLAAQDFYNVLQQWHDSFEAEWRSMPKAADGG